MATTDSNQSTRNKVHIVLFQRNNNDKNLKVLLLQTNKKRGEFWQNITGGVESTDLNKQDAAIREVLEETKLTPSSISQIKLKFKFFDQWKTHVTESVFCAVCQTSNNQDLSPIIDPKEHQSYMWVDAEKVRRNHYFYENNYYAFKVCYEGLKKDE